MILLLLLILLLMARRQHPKCVCLLTLKMWRRLLLPTVPRPRPPDQAPRFLLRLALVASPFSSPSVELEERLIRTAEVDLAALVAGV